MVKNKYPYIADKKLYAAVMYACKMIRETGYFNKSVAIASNHYGISEEAITREIRKRQSVGQKGKKAEKKYKWFIVDQYKHFQYRDDANIYEPDVSRFKVVRAINEENAKLKFKDAGITDFGYNNESFSCVERKIIGEYNTKEEAYEDLECYKRGKPIRKE